MGLLILSLSVLSLITWLIISWIRLIAWAENEAHIWAGELKHQREKEKCSTN